ncbi:hypothetical protein EEW84_18365, partial [Acinetobacter baumannii]
TEEKPNGIKGLMVNYTIVRIMYIMLNKRFGNLPYIRLCYSPYISKSLDLHCDHSLAKCSKHI